MKVTRNEILSLIKSEDYLLTGKTCVCVLVLHSGLEINGVYSSSDKIEGAYVDSCKEMARQRAELELWRIHTYSILQKIGEMPKLEDYRGLTQEEYAKAYNIKTLSDSGVLLRNIHTEEKLIFAPTNRADSIMVLLVNGQDWSAGPFFLNLETIAELSDLID